MKTFLLFVSLILVVPTSAQRGSAPLKFDEFITDAAPEYLFDEEVTFKERVDRFIRRVRLEQKPKVYLVYYRAKIAQPGSYYSDSERRADQAEWEITSRARIDSDDVAVIEGGLRDRETLEFWIGARTGSPPKLSPTYLNPDRVLCPTIWLNAQEHHLDDREPAVFAVELTPKIDSTFRWTVSAGRILEGQGTTTIKVDVAGVRQLEILVVGDAIPSVCARGESKLFTIGPRPILIDEYGGILVTDIRARMDAFLSEISRDPRFTGHMIVYGKRRAPQTLDSSVRLVTNHIAFRNFPKERITIVRGGYRDLGGAELWLLPAGVSPPAPRPSVDTKFVRPRTPVRRPKTNR